MKGKRPAKCDLTAEIMGYLVSLKLKTMASVFADEMAAAAKDGTSPAEVLQRLLAAEVSTRAENRIERRIKESGLPERKLLANFDFAFQTGVDKPQIMELATLSFVGRKQSLIIAGNSGTGKSHIAKALLLTACQQQLRCKYTTASDMLRKLMSGLCDDSLPDKLKAYVKPDVLLIDELGLDRLEQENSRNAALFHKVIEGRYCKSTTILTTNLAFEDLGPYLGDVVSTTATIDRMIHHSVILNIKGPSYRMHESEVINKPVVASKKRSEAKDSEKKT